MGLGADTPSPNMGLVRRRRVPDLAWGWARPRLGPAWN